MGLITGIAQRSTVPYRFTVAEWLTHSPAALEVTGSRPSFGDISENDFSNGVSNTHWLKWCVWHCRTYNVSGQNVKRLSLEGRLEYGNTNVVIIIIIMFNYYSTLFPRLRRWQFVTVVVRLIDVERSLVSRVVCSHIMASKGQIGARMTCIYGVHVSMCVASIATHVLRGRCEPINVGREAQRRKPNIV